MYFFQVIGNYKMKVLNSKMTEEVLIVCSFCFKRFDELFHWFFGIVFQPMDCFQTQFFHISVDIQ